MEAGTPGRASEGKVLSKRLPGRLSLYLGIVISAMECGSYVEQYRGREYVAASTSHCH